jgi:hypothetical protein
VGEQRRDVIGAAGRTVVRIAEPDLEALELRPARGREVLQVVDGEAATLDRELAELGEIDRAELHRATAQREVVNPTDRVAVRHPRVRARDVPVAGIAEHQRAQRDRLGRFDRSRELVESELVLVCGRTEQQLLDQRRRLELEELLELRARRIVLGLAAEHLPTDHGLLDEAATPLELECVGLRGREPAEKFGAMLVEVGLHLLPAQILRQPVDHDIAVPAIAFAELVDDQLAARVALGLQPIGVDEVGGRIVIRGEDLAFEVGVAHGRLLPLPA